MVILALSGCVNANTLAVGGKKAFAADPCVREGFRPALLRLEDVGPGGMYQDEENLQKLKVIADYLFQEGVPFQVALIPRFVVPQKGYDVSIADDTPYANKFVSTIKYLQSKGGIIGIHGYTHQSGTATSGAGFEFFDQSKNPAVPDSYEYARDRINKAIILFQKAGINPAFWETPHYTASAKQYSAFEEQMGLLYEDYHRGEPVNNYKTIDCIGSGPRGYVTVPTPLGYINPEVNAVNMINRIDSVKDDLNSFFYHPIREFSFIQKKQNDKGEVYYTYDQNSPLHMLVKAFKEKGNTFVSIYTLIGFVPAQRLAAIPFTQGDEVLSGMFEPDGRKKILVWNKAGNQWRMYDYIADWYSPRGMKGFAPHGVWIQGWLQEDRAIPLAADIDGDKQDELLIFSPGSGTFNLAENRGEKFILGDKPVFTLTGSKSLRPMLGDVDGDSMADLLFYDPENYLIGVAFSTGGGFKQIAWQEIDLLKGKCQQLVTGDFNGDSKSDIAVLDSDSGECRVLLADRERDFTVSKEPWLLNWRSGEGWKPFAADVNADGKSDLIVYNRTGYWQVAVSDGNRFIQRDNFGPWGRTMNGVPLVADLNGDGRSDLAIVDGTRGKDYQLDIAVSVLGR